jgi:hypothetical protein
VSRDRKLVDQIESEARERERNRLAWNLPYGVTRPPTRRLLPATNEKNIAAGPTTAASDG